MKLNWSERVRKKDAAYFLLSIGSTDTHLLPEAHMMMQVLLVVNTHLGMGDRRQTGGREKGKRRAIYSSFWPRGAMDESMDREGRGEGGAGAWRNSAAGTIYTSDCLLGWKRVPVVVGLRVS